jgi:hypothetical protein
LDPIIPVAGTLKREGSNQIQCNWIEIKRK